ncbi:hypothetical protein Trydic_g3981 [Trypoxylus dichotomus]
MLCAEFQVVIEQNHVLNPATNQTLKCVSDMKHRAQSIVEKPRQIYEAYIKEIPLEALIQFPNYIAFQRKIEFIREKIDLLAFKSCKCC